MLALSCSEVQCDAHVDIFLKSIHAAAGMSRQGFTVVKLTALGNPSLLQRISLAIREVSLGLALAACSCHNT